MKQTALFLNIILFLFSCSNPTSNVKENKSEFIGADSDEKIDTILDDALWAEEYIVKYLDSNKDRLTEVDGHPLTYMKETMVRNERSYVVVKIGHSFEHNYITDQWIYIDSLTKGIYEYDLVNDSLIIWK